MSRGYRIQVPVYAGQAVRGAEDACEVEIGLLPILDDATMRARLREALLEAGWQEGEGAMLERTFGSVKATIDKATQKVTLSADTTITVKATATTAKAAAALAEQQAKAGEERLQRDVAQRIAAAEGDVRAKIDEALQPVYVAALKEKARSLGEVQSIQEGRTADGTLEVTIKIKA